MRQRHYRHVSWHAASNVWVVSIKGTYHGSARFDQEDRAADIAANVLGLRDRDGLRIGKTDPKYEATESHYQYVIYYAPRGKWFAQRRGEFLGQFSSQQAAAKAVCALGWAASIQDLRVARERTVSSAKSKAKKSTAEPIVKPMAKGKAVIKKVKAKSSAKGEIKKVQAQGQGGITRARVRDLWLIYRDASGGKGVGALPGDLQDIAQIPYLTVAKTHVSPVIVIQRGGHGDTCTCMGSGLSWHGPS